MEIVRHRTAIGRSSFSKPIRLALETGIISLDSTLFDYGCGKGQDIIRLQQIGITAEGWDPAFKPDAEKKCAEIVNLGYVINVIEDAHERTKVLLDAWDFTEEVLIVSARTAVEREKFSLKYADGFITEHNTFQKLFTQTELYELIKKITNTEPVAAAPGIFFLFRNVAAKQEYLSRKLLGLDYSSYGLEITYENLSKAYSGLLDELANFFEARGRLPKVDEWALYEQLAKVFTTPGKAFRVLLAARGKDWVEECSQKRRNTLLVFLSLLRFRDNPRLSDFPVMIQNDIKAHFRSYRNAQSEAADLLFSIGNKDLISAAVGFAQVGKRTRDALYVHKSALNLLPPILRVYVGCAGVISGDIEGANIIKLSIETPRVTYLNYPDFDRKPHPELTEFILVSIIDFNMQYRNYSKSTNRPILHRKEEFVAEDYPERDKFARLTRIEEKHGLYKELSGIGYSDFWNKLLERKGYEYRGHRLIRK